MLDFTYYKKKAFRSNDGRARISEIEKEVKCKLREVSWLPNFYFLPPDVQVASTKTCQEGKIYGIDAASGAAVVALNVLPGVHVLDLCAAPGAKLCMTLNLIGCSGSAIGNFVQVLVDAECTHDGSVRDSRHIQKFEQCGWATLSRLVLDAERTDDVTVLQLKLLTNGFRLLKAGGFLVYSTCSLSVAQNEDVVEQFLSQNLSAKFVEIDDTKRWACSPARVPKTLRFDPSTSFTTGAFIAKFTKLTIR
ncbi:uncharacterized protein [Primulina huaijiensis]|uniref:uncharacterized protein n=1 Tax=Primulina huaijiensis TaxID=1492673 RepID=UPI003CC746B8